MWFSYRKSDMIKVIWITMEFLIYWEAKINNRHHVFFSVNWPEYRHFDRKLIFPHFCDSVSVCYTSTNAIAISRSNITALCIKYYLCESLCRISLTTTERCWWNSMAILRLYFEVFMYCAIQCIKVSKLKRAMVESIDWALWLTVCYVRLRSSITSSF